MSEAQQEKPADAWGQPISEERQRELQGYLDRWEAETDHGWRVAPFDGAELNGADVAYLVKQVWIRPDEADSESKVHLEGAMLEGAHLERAYLTFAHLEEAILGFAHLDTLYVNRECAC